MVDDGNRRRLRRGTLAADVRATVPVEFPTARSILDLSAARRARITNSSGGQTGGRFGVKVAGRFVLSASMRLRARVPVACLR